MDLHIARITLIWIEESGLNGATDLANIVDRVGRGIFQELDYTLEASNADEFRRSLRFMDFLVVPRHLAHMTGRRVLTQEWIDGRPMKDLTTEEQLKMVQWGVECSSAQLFRTGSCTRTRTRGTCCTRTRASWLCWILGSSAA